MNVKDFSKLQIEPIEINSSLKEMYDYLTNALPSITRNYNINAITKNEMANTTHEIFTKLGIQLHKIPFLGTEELKTIMKNNIGKETIYEELIKSEQYLFPFDIPINYYNRNIYYGKFNCTYVKLKEDLIQYFNEFDLSSNITLLSVAVYTHELIHTQLESTNSISNYNNSEVLPVFFDKLVVDSLKGYKYLSILNELHRLDLLKKALMLMNDSDLTYFKKIKLSMIVISILKSELLYDKFISSYHSEQKQIIMGIQNVLSGIISIEEFLDYNDISLENNHSIEIIKERVSKLYE